MHLAKECDEFHMMKESGVPAPGFLFFGTNISLIFIP